jgi:hypothetical protein
MIVRVSKRDQHEADLLAQDTVMLLEKLGVSLQCAGCLMWNLRG